MRKIDQSNGDAAPAIIQLYLRQMTCLLFGAWVDKGLRNCSPALGTEPGCIPSKFRKQYPLLLFDSTVPSKWTVKAGSSDRLRLVEMVA